MKNITDNIKLQSLESFYIAENILKKIIGGEDTTVASLDSNKKDVGDPDTISSTKKDVDTISYDTAWNDK